MASFADRVKVTVDSSTAGTGAVTLSTAVSGYQAVPSALDGASIRYVIELGTAWEIGLGVYTHSTLNLTRSLTSSSTGSLLNLNNTAVVFISPAAEDLQYVEVYSSTSDLPSASSNHGRIAHVHGEGAMYFAHAGNWVRLGNYSEITSYTLPTASSSTLGGIKIGSGLSIDGSGVVTASGSSGIALTDLSVTQNSASGSGALSYNNTSGVFSYTPPASSSSSGGSLVPITTTKTVASSGATVFTGTWKAENIAVFLNGVKLQDSEVTATDTQITISATADGDIVEVVEYGAPFASPYASTFPIVTTGATFVTVNYTPDKVAVFKNGVKLRGGGVDFTARNGTSITGFSAFASGDVVEVVEHGSLAESGGGVTAYDNYSDLPSGGNTDGDLGWVKDVSGSGATKALYVWDGSAWDRVYNGAEETLTWSTEPPTSYFLAPSGSAQTITIAATDPEGFPVSYSVDTNPSSISEATISENNGTFTLTPSSDSSLIGNTFSARFKATDGLHVISKSCSVTLGALGSQYNPVTNIAALRSAGITTDGLYYFDNSISNGTAFAAYCNFNYIDGNDWYLLLKVHNQGDMPSGSALWTNTTLHNETDANLTSGNYAKYATWNNIEFTNLQMEMHQGGTAKYPPTMHFSTARTFAAAITLAGGTSAASNVNNTVPATSTTPSYTTNIKYHDTGFEKNGNSFTDANGGEANVNNYGIAMWSLNTSNSTTAEGYSSVGRAGAWIGCPLDEQSYAFGNNSGNAGSGFGFGASAGNSPRTTSAGYNEWGLSASTNTLPAYVWIR